MMHAGARSAAMVRRDARSHDSVMRHVERKPLGGYPGDPRTMYNGIG